MTSALYYELFSVDECHLTLKCFPVPNCHFDMNYAVHGTDDTLFIPAVMHAEMRSVFSPPILF